MMWKGWEGPAGDSPAGVDVKLEDPPIPTLGMTKLSIDWANAFASRLFYDFSRNPHWMGKVQDRIDRKLATVRLPYFIETLKLSHLEAGPNTPKIIDVNEPTVNEWGLWLDGKVRFEFGLSYSTLLFSWNTVADCDWYSKRR